MTFLGNYRSYIMLYTVLPRNNASVPLDTSFASLLLLPEELELQLVSTAGWAAHLTRRCRSGSEPRRVLEVGWGRGRWPVEGCLFVFFWYSSFLMDFWIGVDSLQQIFGWFPMCFPFSQDRV